MLAGFAQSGLIYTKCTPRAAAASALCVPRRPARPVPKLTSLASGRGRHRQESRAGARSAGRAALPDHHHRRDVPLAHLPVVVHARHDDGARTRAAHGPRARSSAASTSSPRSTARGARLLHRGARLLLRLGDPVVLLARHAQRRLGDADRRLLLRAFTTPRSARCSASTSRAASSSRRLPPAPLAAPAAGGARAATARRRCPRDTSAPTAARTRRSATSRTTRCRARRRRRRCATAWASSRRASRRSPTSSASTGTSPAPPM